MFRNVRLILIIIPIIILENVYIIVHNRHMLIVRRDNVYKLALKAGMALILHGDVKELALKNNSLMNY